MRSPVVLVPGLVCDAAVWQHAAQALRTDRDVSIAHHGALDSLEAMAAKILAETPGDFAVAGHSMGGRVALEMFRHAPQRIRGLALLDTGVTPLAEGAAGATEIAGRHELLDIARRRGMGEMARRWVRGMVWKPRLDDATLIDTVIRMFERSTAEVFAAQIRALLARPDASALLAAVRCPTLVLCGADDGWSPPERHREMAAKIQDAVLEIVPECGHMCTLERPDVTTGALRTWIATVDSIGAR